MKFDFPNYSFNSAERWHSGRNALLLQEAVVKNTSVTENSRKEPPLRHKHLNYTSCTDRLQFQEQTCPERPSHNNSWDSFTLTEVSNFSAPAKQNETTGCNYSPSLCTPTPTPPICTFFFAQNFFSNFCKANHLIKAHKLFQEIQNDNLSVPLQCNSTYSIKTFQRCTLKEYCLMLL